MRYLLRVTITTMIIFIFGSLPEWSSIKAQQPDSTQEHIYYNRNDNTFLKNYNPSDKAKYFPLNKVTAGTGIWTELNPNVPRVDYIGVDFINPDTGWAVGLWGAAIKTTNGGTNWQTLETPTGEIMLKVHSCNGKIVIAVGHNGTILRSSDGGESFTQLTGITTQELWGVRMLNETLGWICGRNQTLLKTTDAGLTWLPVVTGYNLHYWQFDFLTEEYFMIACSQGRVLKTTDGGQSFTQYQAGSLQDLYTIDIIDSQHIAAAGNFGKNVYSSDGGVTWTENQYTSLSINWIQYINRDTGYITIGTISSFYKTTNRGQSWFNPGFNGTGEWQFELLNESLGYGVGAGLKITKTNDGFITGRNLILNVDFRDVYFFTETTGFALSWFLYKTTNGGISWQRKVNAPGGNDILFLDSLTGFIGGSNLFKTTDGGENWYQVNGVPGGVGKIFFINSLTGWATSGRNILKTTDGGENWSVQFTHINDSFTSIFFIDSLNGWATSRYVHQTTDGGLNWIQRMDILAFFSQDVHFNDSFGFVIDNLTLYKSTDNGETWSIQLNSPYIIKSFGWLSEEGGLIMGGSVVYETRDSGNTWVLVNELTGIGLQKFHAPLNYLGYAVGNQGLIYKYIDSSYIPLELISFTGFYDNEKITLSWKTATEINNNGFEVQKSKDKENWYPIGFVQGSGSSTENNSYNYTDNSTLYEKNYYRLKQIDHDGSYEYSNIIEVSARLSSYQLYQNYPNPFNPTTAIKYDLPTSLNPSEGGTLVNLAIYDILGKRVKVLVNEVQQAGRYEVNFDASGLSSGVYFYKINSGKFIETRKMLLMK